MTQLEDPIVTVVRLLDINLNVTKEDGSLADIEVTPEYVDRELPKNVDGQVTVGLDRSEDQKLGFSASLRRRVGYLRVNAWAVDRPNLSGRQIRNKLRQEVNRVIREKRTKPNQTTYNYVGTGTNSNSHTAYFAASTTEYAPSSQNWTELSSADYEKLWQSDNNSYSFGQTENGCYSFLMFRIKLASDTDVVKRLELTFEGYGNAPSGNGATVKVWNFQATQWQNSQTGTANQDETLKISLESNFTDYIDSDGFLYLLAKTTNPSNGATPSTIYCDFVECVAQVEGVCYVDMVSYRDQDELRIKPYIWRTEFLVKTWLFENVTVT